MFLCSFEEKSQDMSKVKFNNNQDTKVNENLKLERIANHFISSIFKSVLEKYIKGKETSSNKASLLAKKGKNKKIVLNFVNALFKETNNEFMNSIIKSRNTSNKKCFKDNKSLFIFSKKKVINETKSKIMDIGSVKSEYNTSNKLKKVFKANSNISCETDVSTFDKENIYVKSFNTSNKKKGKKINIQSNIVVSKLCTRSIPQREKCKTNYNLDENLKLMKRMQELTDNKILFLKHKPNKTNNKLKKEKDNIQQIFKYDNNRKKVHKIKKENNNTNVGRNNCINKNCSSVNKIYKHIIVINSDRNNKNKIIKVHNNNKEKNSIQKINIVRVYNKKVIQQRTKIFNIKNGNAIIA